MIDIAKLQTVIGKYGIDYLAERNKWNYDNYQLIILLPDQQKISVMRWSWLIDPTKGWSWLIDPTKGWADILKQHRIILLKLPNLEVIYDSLK